jgi:hypothetical protein
MRFACTAAELRIALLASFAILSVKQAYADASSERSSHSFFFTKASMTRGHQNHTIATEYFR